MAFLFERELLNNPHLTCLFVRLLRCNFGYIAVLCVYGPLHFCKPIIQSNRDRFAFVYPASSKGAYDLGALMKIRACRPYRPIGFKHP